LAGIHEELNSIYFLYLSHQTKPMGESDIKIVGQQLKPPRTPKGCEKKYTGHE
jgi:hypothetical protein